MLVFAVLLILFSLPAALVMAFIPLPNTSAPDLPSNFGSILRVGFVVFYGMFAALGGFWLYFFNRRSVKEQFEGNRPGVEVAVPGLPIATPDAKPARPLSITIIGWFLLVGSALAPLSLLLAFHVPQRPNADVFSRFLSLRPERRARTCDLDGVAIGCGSRIAETQELGPPRDDRPPVPGHREWSHTRCCSGKPHPIPAAHGLADGLDECAAPPAGSVCCSRVD